MFQRIATLYACLHVAAETAERAMGLGTQNVFTADHAWLWWIPAFGWVLIGIYNITGVDR